MSRLQQTSETVAQLCQELRAIVRKGLGREVLSPTEEQAIDENVEATLAKVFSVYAELKLADKMGILTTYMKSMGLIDLSDEEE